ncbi:MAG: GtrA family protein [Prevotella sp.]|nr:GtrA family protein [Prevotella sp.]
MKRLLYPFHIKREERPLAFCSLLLVAFLNGLLLYHYHDTLTLFADDYHKMFRDGFNISGFDAWTYTVLSKWSATQYNIYRHPLLAIFMFVPYLITQLLNALTGINCAIYVVAAMQVAAGFYAIIFLYRIFREVLYLQRADASLLSFLFCSFAYVMLTMMVPDHFNFSMCLLLFILYVTGTLLRKGKAMGTWQTIILFALTAGISLNNGLKVFIAAFFANGKKFFRPKYFLLAIILPSALIWGFARLEYHIFEAPEAAARQHQTNIRNREFRDSLFKAYSQQYPKEDSASIYRRVRHTVQELAYAKYMRDHNDPRRGKPIAKGEFVGWTDISTDRWASIEENLFGESLQLHTDHLLDDILEGHRPMIVRYQYDANYVIEGIIVLLFVLGIVCGFMVGFRRDQVAGIFLCLTLFWFLMDMIIHVALGFGLNEVYIMTGHWVFVIPIAMSYLFIVTRGRAKKMLQIITGILATSLFIYNVSLIATYLHSSPPPL